MNYKFFRAKAGADYALTQSFPEIQKDVAGIFELQAKDKCS